MARDIVVVTEKYTKDGQEKAKFTKIGVILESNGKEFMLLDPTVNLAGVLMKQRILDPGKAGDMVMCSIFDGDTRGQQSAPTNAPADDYSSDIPF